MAEEKRERLNALSFLDSMVASGGYKLRPAGYLTVNCLRLLEMSLGRGDEALAALSRQEMEEQVYAFLFIQAAPVPQVNRAVRQYERARFPRGAGVAPMSREDAWNQFIDEHVAPFLAEIPPDGVAAVYEQLQQLEEADAATVDAEPPETHGKREVADPN